MVYRSSEFDGFGGNAVFTARALYWLTDPEYDFDDAALCLAHGIIVKSSIEQGANSVSVYPNPAGDNATLVLTAPLAESGTIVIFDALGAEVLRVTVPQDVVQHGFSTALLSRALYHYKVYSNSVPIGEGKLTIIR